VKKLNDMVPHFPVPDFVTKWKLGNCTI